jgi:hypothetical protein
MMQVDFGQHASILLILNPNIDLHEPIISILPHGPNHFGGHDNIKFCFLPFGHIAGVPLDDPNALSLFSEWEDTIVEFSFFSPEDNLVVV